MKKILLVIGLGAFSLSCFSMKIEKELRIHEVNEKQIWPPVERKQEGGPIVLDRESDDESPRQHRHQPPVKPYLMPRLCALLGDFCQAGGLLVYMSIRLLLGKPPLPH
ncbi:MAG: hypothetical protein M1549_02515 [Candidatus Dependentiae bacterium]|jgi:hypothetical protein|nr:hypothetical protein [Candidatus Dependentiae bacterium]